MTPLPFSYSSFSTFITCPRRYYAQNVAKTVKEDQNQPHLVWGNQVHKDFENRQRDGVALPTDIAEHEDFMRHLEALPGEKGYELEIGFGAGFKPCGFWDKGTVIYRGKVDWVSITPHQVVICDFKTGKRNPKWLQLQLNAIWAFNAYPTVSHVEMNFYWTKDKVCDTQTIHKDEWRQVWREKVEPDLRQYVTAFKDDIWQPRRSGLCKAHCPVLDCEHNGRSR